MMAANPEANKTFLLVLTRHGATDANQTGYIQGQLDTPLSDKGRQQAKLLGKRLSSQEFTHVYSSDLIRSHETAELAGVGCTVDITCDARLRERYFGVAQGQPKIIFTQEASQHGVDLSEYTPSGAETPEHFSERVIDFFTDICLSISSYQLSEGKILTNILAGADQTSLAASVLVVSHGGTVRVLLSYFKSQLNCQLPSAVGIPPNTSLCVFRVTLDSNGDCVSLHCDTLYDTLHLK